MMCSARCSSDQAQYSARPPQKPAPPKSHASVETATTAGAASSPGVGSGDFPLKYPIQRRHQRRSARTLLVIGTRCRARAPGNSSSSRLAKTMPPRTTPAA